MGLSHQQTWCLIEISSFESQTKTNVYVATKRLYALANCANIFIKDERYIGCGKGKTASIAFIRFRYSILIKVIQEGSMLLLPWFLSYQCVCVGSSIAKRFVMQPFILQSHILNAITLYIILSTYHKIAMMRFMKERRNTRLTILTIGARRKKQSLSSVLGQ